MKVNPASFSRWAIPEQVRAALRPARLERVVELLLDRGERGVLDEATRAARPAPIDLGHGGHETGV